MANLHVKWSNRLSVKLTAVMVLLTLATVATFGVLGSRMARLHLIDEVVHSAALLSDTIKRSTYLHMLDDERETVYGMMTSIGRQEGIEKVRMFNKEGYVTFSTELAEIGTLVDKRAESCYACHAADQPIVRLEVPSRSRIYVGPAGHRILGMVTPIYNEESCYAAPCHVHPAARRVLGVVDVDLSLAEIDRGIERLQQGMVALSGATVLALAAIVYFATRRFVVRPVGHLVEGTQKITKGNLAHEIPVETEDEIGVLARSFNGMTRFLRAARKEIGDLMENLERQVEERTADLKATQGQLIQSEKMASLGKLSASIAHEINNPLSGILTSAKLLIRTGEEGPLDAAAQASFLRHLRLVERETQRCTTIVRNLLGFARQRELTLTEVDVKLPIEEALGLLGNQIAIQGITLERRLDSVPVVRADVGQLRQAFVNVALNACEAMSKGGTLTVSARFLPAENMVEVEFTDTGAGIPPDNLSKILEPFFTTKEKGTGLGLSVVYGVVERHGGKVDILSRIGEGTTVQIRLPVAGVQEADG
jgi:two-component system NtrC family sensor kinase